MAAWTESFTDLRKDTNIVGNIVSKVLEARKMAEDERNYAKVQLDKHLKRTKQQGTRTLQDYGIGRGYFFKKALGHEFGGNAFLEKKEKVDFYIQKGKLLKNPRQNFWKLFDSQQKKSKAQRFREKFRYREGFEQIDSLRGKTPILTAQTPRLPAASKKVKPKTSVVGEGSAKKIQKATTSSSKRVTKEDILSVLTELVASLEKTANSIQNNVTNSSAAIFNSSDLQQKTLEQLKYKENTLESKLDRLIEAIENQTSIQKSGITKAVAKERELSLENQVDVAATKAFDDLTTKENEAVENYAEPVVPTTPITNVQNVNIGATPAQRVEHQQMQAYGNIPQLETGGIYSGPDSGYLVNLKAGDKVVPLDNNFTQGEPSAIDGKVRKMPKYERGTQQSSVGGRLGFGITNMAGIAKGGTTQSSAMAQPLVDAMSLPMMATGGAILATVSKLMNSMGSESAAIAPEIEKISRPIADVFGLPSAITQKAKIAGKKSSEEKEEESIGAKNILAKMTEGFGKLLEGLGKKIEENPPSNPAPSSSSLIPGNAPAEIKALMETISGGEGGPNSVQGIGEVPGLSDMTIDEAIQKAKSYIGRGSQTGALGAYQFHSTYLRQRAIDAGLDPAKDKFSFENQTQIMRNFMTSVWTAGGGTGGEAGLLKALQSGQLESTVFPKLAKDLGWPSLPGGSQPNVHTPEAASRYRAHLKKYQQLASTSTPGTQPTPTNTPRDLGQAISQNYGMSVGEERQFTHPQYGLIKAHKTRTGFDFYDGMTKLDMSSGKPQAKSIVEYFQSTNGGRPQSSPANQAASLRPPSSTQSLDRAQAISRSTSGSKPSLTFLNIGGEDASNQVASTTSQPSGTKLSEGNPIARELYPLTVLS